MIEINWNPVSHLGPIPVNWYGITLALGFLVGGWLVRRWAPKYQVPRESVEGLLLWIIVGSVIGARVYYGSVDGNRDTHRGSTIIDWHAFFKTAKHTGGIVLRNIRRSSVK